VTDEVRESFRSLRLPNSISAAAGFQPLTDVDQIGRAVEESWGQPVLIFKHSSTCGVSAQAYDELMDMLAEPQAERVYLVHVQTSRAVSDAIARRFGRPAGLILNAAQDPQRRVRRARRSSCQACETNFAPRTFWKTLRI
jgi:hypothetical protein